MRFWWCNQSRCFEVEALEGVVQASSQMTSLRYRETVASVRAGDVCVHYHKRWGIVAVSRAKDNAKGIVALKDLGDFTYGEGWIFNTEYHFFSRPLAKKAWIADVTPKRNDPDWPVNANGMIKQAYFIPFSPGGYRAVMKTAPRSLPSWARRSAPPSQG